MKKLNELYDLLLSSRKLVDDIKNVFNLPYYPTSLITFCKAYELINPIIYEVNQLEKYVSYIKRREKYLNLKDYGDIDGLTRIFQKGFENTYHKKGRYRHNYKIPSNRRTKTNNYRSRNLPKKRTPFL